MNDLKFTTTEEYMSSGPVTDEMIFALCQQMWQEYGYGDGDWYAMRAALEAALAAAPKPEQEPVAWAQKAALGKAWGSTANGN